MTYEYYQNLDTLEKYERCVVDDIYRTIGWDKPQDLYKLVYEARNRTEFYEQGLPAFKEALAKALSYRLDRATGDVQGYACFVKVVETLKKAKALDLLEDAKPEWVKRTMQAIAHTAPAHESYPGAANDWATTTVYFLSGIIKLPKLAAAFKESYEGMGINRKRLMQELLQKNYIRHLNGAKDDYERGVIERLTIFTEEVRELLGLPYSPEELTPPLPPRPGILSRIRQRFSSSPISRLTW